ncbi:MAG TPA: sugar phosphate isomerase/epimerase [Pyrinomonadaceae bacterium]|nr:sugar phosphate isomerase/epimerase [Pyrinomonadaceae bacterium]
MLQVGIFTGYFPYTLEETAQRIRRAGFNTVQLDVGFKDMTLPTEDINARNSATIRDTFRRHDLPVSCISCYTNLIDPDAEKRRRHLDRLKQIIRHARELGSPYVISETGTYNPASDWVHHPKNKTEGGYEECRDVIGELVDFARQHGAVFLIEPYVNNVIGSIEETLRLLADINDSHLGLLMDPTNYFDEHNIDEMDKVLDNIFNALSHKIKIAHAKDVKRAEGGQQVRMADIDADESHALRGVGEIDLPAPGLGALNYDLYLKRLSHDHPNIPLIIEHLEEEDVPRAKKFVDDKLVLNGC